MAEYPDNSHSTRERQDSGQQPTKKFDKVVTNETKIRKKTDAEKFANVFVPEDVDNIKSYILMDVLLTHKEDELLEIYNH